MFRENTTYIKEDIKEIITERFKNIIAGKGPMIPRIAIKVALDSLFSEIIIEACCCGYDFGMKRKEISRDCPIHGADKSPQKREVPGPPEPPRPKNYNPKA